ncbi:hypothetical protein [Streptomyces sp. CAS3]
MREGERPADDEVAGRIFEGLYERYLGTEIEHAPTARIKAYITALLSVDQDASDGLSLIEADHVEPGPRLRKGPPKESAELGVPASPVRDVCTTDDGA